jgi:hypothetical protein
MSGWRIDGTVVASTGSVETNQLVRSIQCTETNVSSQAQGADG